MGLQLLCVKTYPFVGITRFRFHGYNLSLNKKFKHPSYRPQRYIKKR